MDSPWQYVQTWFMGAVMLVFVPLLQRSTLFHPRFTRETRESIWPRRFFLADFFVLLVHWQVVGGIALMLTTSWPFDLRMLLLLTLGTAQGTWWAMTVAWITGIGIASARDRLWFLAVLAPLGFFTGQLIFLGIIGALPLLAFTILYAAFNGAIAILVFIASLVAYLVGIYWSIAFTRGQCLQILARHLAEKNRVQ